MTSCLILDVGGTILTRARSGAFARLRGWLATRRPGRTAAPDGSEARALLTAPDLDAAMSSLAIHLQLSCDERIEVRRLLEADDGDAQLVPGALPLIDLARSAGWGVLLATNAVAWASQLPSALLERVDSVFASSTLGVLKTDAEFWDQVCLSTEIRPEDCLVIGNSYQSDCKAPADAGFAVLQVGPGHATLQSVASAFVQCQQRPAEADFLAAGQVEAWGGRDVVVSPALDRWVVEVTRRSVSVFSAGVAGRGQIVRRRSGSACLVMPCLRTGSSVAMAWCSLRPDRRSQRVAPELAALLARHGIDKTDLDPGLLRQLSGQLSDAADPALKEKRLADIDALLRAQAFLGGNA